MELRCRQKLHAIVLGPGQGILEIPCSSRWCGAGNGAVILHRFDLSTGLITEDKVYRNPGRRLK